MTIFIIISCVRSTHHLLAIGARVTSTRRRQFQA
jgi:hypothetical protein